VPRSRIAPPEDHEDLITTSDRTETVRDDDAGAVFHQLVESFLNETLTFGIEAAHRFIENKDRRVGKNRPGDRNALTLSAGKLGATISHEGLVALGEALDELMGIRLFRGLDNFVVARLGLAVGNVLFDAASKKKHLLGNEGKIPSKGRE
jgi:hypothetical protein